jgi:hypothetical protein
MPFDDKGIGVWIRHVYAKKDVKGCVTWTGNSGDHPELSNFRDEPVENWMPNSRLTCDSPTAKQAPPSSRTREWRISEVLSIKVLIGNPLRCWEYQTWQDCPSSAKELHKAYSYGLRVWKANDSGGTRHQSVKSAWFRVSREKPNCISAAWRIEMLLASSILFCHRVSHP